MENTIKKIKIFKLQHMNALKPFWKLSVIQDYLEWKGIKVVKNFTEVLNSMNNET